MVESSSLRLGLSMRVVAAPGYREDRDALARDWGVFMSRVMPEVSWLPVPNLGRAVVDYVAGWGLNGFILTGGNDLGEAPIRDETEKALLDYALEHSLPVLGVCRGLQMMCHYFGRAVTPCPVEDHVAVRHPVRLVDPPFTEMDESMTVNSFHERCVGRASDFTGPLTAFAVSPDGLVEGAYCREKKLLGIMWHPERNHPSAEADMRLVRAFFGV